MVRWVVGSILHGGPMYYFSFQPELHDRGMYHPVCGMMHTKDPLRAQVCVRVCVCAFFKETKIIS